MVEVGQGADESFKKYESAKQNSRSCAGLHLLLLTRESENANQMASKIQNGTTSCDAMSKFLHYMYTSPFTHSQCNASIRKILYIPKQFNLECSLQIPIAQETS
jgi:hypothetical protein